MPEQHIAVGDKGAEQPQDAEQAGALVVANDDADVDEGMAPLLLLICCSAADELLISVPKTYGIPYATPKGSKA